VRTFRSDNNAGLCPEARAALVSADDGSHDIAYGDDAWTARAVDAFRGLVGPEAGVWFVATGTAANTLAIASLTEPWQQVVCHAHSHYNEDESTAPERITHCRTVRIVTDDSRLTPADVEGAATHRGDVHQPQPGVVTISNPTEFGTVYTPEQTAALAETAHRLDYRLHVDGARLANAVASLGCDLRALTTDAGVDAVSFGGTKNGLALGEAVLLLPQGDGAWFRRAAAAFPHHRKSTGHLLSKHRFVAAPFAATLADGAWLRHAGHANAMARRLAEGLAARGLPAVFPVEANAVFVDYPAAVADAVERAGLASYRFGGPARNAFRLMASFDTRPEDVDALLAAVDAADLR
jgi:threonine aldolase